MSTLRSREVLHDAKEAILRFKYASNDLDRRLNWVLSLTLLRTAGHTLEKIDFKKFPKLKEKSNWDNDKNITEINATIEERCESIKCYQINFDWVPENIIDEKDNVIDSYATLQYTGEYFYPGCPADFFLDILFERWDKYLRDFEKVLITIKD